MSRASAAGYLEPMRPGFLLVTLALGPTAHADPHTWSADGACLGGVCTGVPLPDPDAWSAPFFVDGRAARRRTDAPAPFVDLIALTDPAGRVVIVSGIVDGRAPCLALRDELDGVLGRKALETSTDWWTWRGGQSLRIRKPLRVERLGSVLPEACVVDRLDPRFDQRTGTWKE